MVSKNSIQTFPLRLGGSCERVLAERVKVSELGFRSVDLVPELGRAEIKEKLLGVAMPIVE